MAQTLLRHDYIEYIGGGSSKFYLLTLTENARRFTTTRYWSKIGATGQSKPAYDGASRGIAEAAYDKLLREKRNEGYTTANLPAMWARQLGVGPAAPAAPPARPPVPPRGRPARPSYQLIQPTPVTSQVFAAAAAQPAYGIELHHQRATRAMLTIHPAPMKATLAFGMTETDSNPLLAKLNPFNGVISDSVFDVEFTDNSLTLIDIMRYQGEEVIDLPLMDRYQLLLQAAGELKSEGMLDGRWEVAELFHGTRKAKLLEAARQQGAFFSRTPVLKGLDSPYRPARTWLIAQ